MFDNVDDAMACDDLDRREVWAELANHDACFHVDGLGRFVDDETGEVIAACDPEGFYTGRDVLAYLGY